MLKTFRTIAFTALIKTATRISHMTDRPMNSFTRSMAAETASRLFISSIPPYAKGAFAALIPHSAEIGNKSFPKSGSRFQPRSCFKDFCSETKGEVAEIAPAFRFGGGAGRCGS
ncbi:hypothetical protein [Gemmobacter lutimaris]|uniref:hypothetical protein n=1 Tax=Gemmobacter lutimaris TaxID=2306023 RepID=UPI001F263F13|nr:hypothetical protein [Gemmobacter lutimaris]